VGVTTESCFLFLGTIGETIHREVLDRAYSDLLSFLQSHGRISIFLTSP
jgi:hypothetical protein